MVSTALQDGIVPFLALTDVLSAVKMDFIVFTVHFKKCNSDNILRICHLTLWFATFMASLMQIKLNLSLFKILDFKALCQL